MALKGQKTIVFHWGVGVCLCQSISVLSYDVRHKSKCTIYECKKSQQVNAHLFGTFVHPKSTMNERFFRRTSQKNQNIFSFSTQRKGFRTILLKPPIESRIGFKLNWSSSYDSSF